MIEKLLKPRTFLSDPTNSLVTCSVSINYIFIIGSIQFHLIKIEKDLSREEAFNSKLIGDLAFKINSTVYRQQSY